MDVTTWYLEQTDPADARPAKDPREPIQIIRAEVPSPEFSRFLYTAVGGDWYWTERLSWTREQWRARLERPGVETWVAWLHGTPAGYAELEGLADGTVDLSFFGLLPFAIGKGIGGRLLEFAVARAWDLAGRWPGHRPTRRVTVNTCSLDSPHALPNYQARGFRIYDTKVTAKTLPPAPPGPWPGA